MAVRWRPFLISLTAMFAAFSFESLEAKPCRDKVRQEIPTDQLKAGDIIFISSTSRQSDMLQEATRSHWTHVGVLVPDPENPENLVVFEASSKTIFTPIENFIAKSRGAQVSIKRVDEKKCESQQRAADGPVKCNVALNFSQLANISIRKHRNKSYDSLFQPDVEKLYCSELVDRIYQESFRLQLAPWQSFGEVLGLSEGEDWRRLQNDPARKHTYDTIMKRFQNGRTFDPSTPVITPIQMYNSEFLQNVYECEELIQPAGSGFRADHE